MAEEPATLNGISALRGFFRTNQTPIYFISPVAFNLLGIDRWVRRFEYVNYFDSFDGGHPRVFVPQRTPHAQFGSIEDVCNYLMTHAQVREFVARRRAAANGARQGRVRVLRRGDGTAGGEPRPRHRAATRRSAPATGLEDRHHPAGRRGGRSERSERARARLELRRADSAGAGLGPRRPTSSFRRRTATAARRRSSFAARPSGTPTLLEMFDQELKVMRRIDPRGGRRGGVHHASRHRDRAADDRPDRTPGADAVPRRLVRQRHPPRGVVGRQPGAGAGIHAPARRPARQRGLPRPARGRLPRRRRLRRALSGRDQPAPERDQLDDERLGRAPTPTCRCSCFTWPSTSTSTT